MQVGKRQIGPGHPTFMVAELSANHGQSLDVALRSVEAAARAGADAIKLQTYTPETMTLRSNRAEFMVEHGLPGAGRSLFDLYAEAQTPWEWHAPLKAAAEAAGIEFFSTPFDRTAVEFLGRLGVCAIKIASFELVDLALIRDAAALGKPLIMSTGMASLAEIEAAVATARAGGAHDLVLLRCTSAYPAAPSSMRLQHIPLFQDTFGVLAGLSDHTPGVAAAAAATALGACLIEKHFMLSRDVGGPDAAFSLSPEDFRNLVDVVREVEAATAPATFESESEERAARVRRSLWVVRDVGEGEGFTASNVRSLRPADGLAPRHLETVLQATARRPIRAGTPLAWPLVDQGAEQHSDGTDKRRK